MADVDFMNSLVINLIDGIVTDSNTKTESAYKKYDKEFLNQDLIEEKLNRIFFIIESIFYNQLFNSKIFYRKNYFWTLFVTLNHQLFGSLDVSIPRNPKFDNQNFDTNINTFISKLSLFESEFLDAEYDSENAPHNILEFEKYHRTRTTSKEERITRVRILSEYLMD